MKTGGDAAAYNLGIEGGGTKTVALSSTGERRQFGPLNLKLSTDRQLRAILREFQPMRAAVCLAGCHTATDRQRLFQVARSVWRKAESIFVGNDLDSGLTAAFGLTNPGIYVLSGTGSVVVGRNAVGTVARAGGWGHLLGDHGSGYWIGSTGLRAAVREYDRHHRVNARLARILRRLCLNSPEQLVDWIHRVTKDEVAALTAEVLNDDAGLMLQAASFLAQDCHAVAVKLGLTKPAVALAGGVLQNYPKLATLLSNRIRTMLPGATVKVLRRDTVEGALLLAGAVLPSPSSVIIHPSSLPLTEQRNPRTMDLDRRSVPQLIDTMLSEEARVIPAIRRQKRAIAGCIQTIVASFQRGGRLFYVGAGTSGRIGVLDASECPPTFSTTAEMVQGIIAGGAPALHSPIEAGEDNRHAGADAIANRNVGKHDVVVGIAASGRTPFVLAALDEAKQRGAQTFLLSFSPPLTRTHTPITILTGPEVVTGSTRLKAGTATKLVLNMLTTISMIRLGKVASNLMVDVKPTNEKLRGRACRIVATLRDCSEAEARQRLVRMGWNVKRALGKD